MMMSLVFLVLVLYFTMILCHGSLDLYTQGVCEISQVW